MQRTYGCRMYVVGCGAGPWRPITSPRSVHVGTEEAPPMPASGAAPASPPAPAKTVSARPQLLFFYSDTSGSSRRVEGFLAQVLQRRRNHQSFELRRIDADRHAELV